MAEPPLSTEHLVRTPSVYQASGAAGSVPISVWHLHAPAPMSAMSPSLAAGIHLYRMQVKWSLSFVRVGYTTDRCTGTSASSPFNPCPRRTAVTR